jgi:hypothetical protein
MVYLLGKRRLTKGTESECFEAIPGVGVVQHRLLIRSIWLRVEVKIQVCKFVF